jgi:hypothetical protein
VHRSHGSRPRVYEICRRSAGQSARRERSIQAKDCYWTG